MELVLSGVGFNDNDDDDEEEEDNSQSSVGYQSNHFTMLSLNYVR